MPLPISLKVAPQRPVDLVLGVVAAEAYFAEPSQPWARSSGLRARNLARTASSRRRRARTLAFPYWTKHSQPMQTAVIKEIAQPHVHGPNQTDATGWNTKTVMKRTAPQNSVSQIPRLSIAVALGLKSVGDYNASRAGAKLHLSVVIDRLSASWSSRAGLASGLTDHTPRLPG